jgi:hypothetical protein
LRTSPYSRHYPHFNGNELREELRLDGISYVFLGKELGGRPSRSELYSHGIADYERMAETSEFAKGLDRVVEGAKNYRIALMCSERDPLHCHRCLLVGRALAERGIGVSHILDDGRVVSHTEIEDRLLEITGRNAEDLFTPRAERLAAAYRERARKLFGFTDAEFSHIKARHVVAAKRNPYEALGVDPSISNEDLKSHYRRLVADNHPDKLLARGVPVEFVTIATEKVATITAAYEAIAKERSI